MSVPPVRPSVSRSTVTFAPVYSAPSDECVTVTREPDALSVSLPPVNVSSVSARRYVPDTVTASSDAPCVDSSTRTMAVSARAGAGSGRATSASSTATHSANLFFIVFVSGPCMASGPFCSE